MATAWEGAVAWLDGHGDASAVGKAVDAGLGPLLEDWTLMRVERVSKQVAAGFERAMREGGLGEALGEARKALGPLKEVCQVIDRKRGDRAGESCTVRLHRTMNNALLLNSPQRLGVFRRRIYWYLRGQFKKHQANQMIDQEDDEEDEQSSDGGEEGEDDVDKENVDVDVPFDEFCSHIATLDWLLYLEEPLSDTLCQETEKYISRTCKGNFEQELLLDKVRSWLDRLTLEWLRSVLKACVKQDEGGSSFCDEKFQQWSARLEFHVFEKLCELRMSELFDIITEFPESSPALIDLKSCLARTHQYRELVQNLRYSFASRLLHPGANTAQILDVYISTIKALRLLDSSGVLLEAISEPIKAYLRKRDDTVRCIVTALTDDSSSELFEELGRSGDIKPIAHNYDDEEDEEDDDDEPHGAWQDENSNSANNNAIEMQKYEKWTPDPIEADPRKTSRSRKSNDILSMLVHIYGSKELFVNEFRIMLADKLLSSLDFDTEREVRNLELLKLRFGEGSMLNCEIMVKDIEDSKRVNANIKNTLKSKTDDSKDVEVTIISKQFWPNLHGEDIQLHPDIKKRVDVISHEYSVLKNPRQLVWKPNLGLVNLELEFGDGQSKVFTVAPLLATLIMYIGERSESSNPWWTLPELADIVQADQDTTRKRMSYWVNQGVVRVGSSDSGEITYAGVETLAEDQLAVNAESIDDDAAGQAVNPDAQLEQEMKVYEDFVRGMLNNYESLPLDRIHNMLKMFVSTGEHKYDKTMDQLGSFLNTLVANESFGFSAAGEYYIKKK